MRKSKTRKNARNGLASKFKSMSKCHATARMVLPAMVTLRRGILVRCDIFQRRSSFITNIFEYVVRKQLSDA